MFSYAIYFSYLFLFIRHWLNDTPIEFLLYSVVYIYIYPMSLHTPPVHVSYAWCAHGTTRLVHARASRNMRVPSVSDMCTSRVPHGAFIHFGYFPIGSSWNVNQPCIVILVMFSISMRTFVLNFNIYWL